MLWKTIDIADTERGLLYKRNRLDKVLEPGRHRVNLLVSGVKVVKHDVSNFYFSEAGAKFLLKANKDKLEKYIDAFEMTDFQVGLLYRGNNLETILAPGEFVAMWKDVEDYRVEMLDISNHYEIEDAKLGLLGRGLKAVLTRKASQAVMYFEVPDEHVGMLMVNGKYEKLLESGRYGYWKYNRSVQVKQIDLRLLSEEVSGQEILTKDRVSLRINLSATYRVLDPEAVSLKVNNMTGFVYRELQLKLREAVGTATLDELLEDKNSLNSVILESSKSYLQHYGIDVVDVGVKDIILPGDMKVILNKVVEAQKEAEANLIKRREETQAMRSLHNTAKVMENNPVLLRLKELESLERITAKIDNISVYGGLDNVLNGLVNISPK